MNSIIYLLSDTARLLRRNFDTKVRRLGVTSVQARLLLVMSKIEGQNQASYAERLDVEPISLCRLVDRMEASGILVRQKDPNDRRAWRLFLTDKSRAMLKQLDHCIEQMEREAIVGVTAESCELFNEMLTTMHTNISQTIEQAKMGNG